MNGERVATLALALCCLFALGTAAGMLHSSVSTTPDDVINVDYARLPLPTDQAQRLKSRFQRPSGHSSTIRRSRPADAGDVRARRSRPDSADDPRPANDVRDGPKRAHRGGNDGSRSDAGRRPTTPSLLDRLLALLRALLAFLLGVVPWLLLLAGVAVAVAARDRIAAALRPHLARLAPGARGDGEADAPAPAPENEVERAWVEMVERLGLADDRSRTAGECARQAVESGVDPDVVEQITRPFRAVTYGGETVTDRHVDRARTGLQRFRAQFPGEGRT
ncbi:MAG: DUF4129 domain-containing protein [Haloarculaceae archaeon]